MSKNSSIHGVEDWVISSRDRNLFGLTTESAFAEYDSVYIDGVSIEEDSLFLTRENAFTIVQEADHLRIDYSFPQSDFYNTLDIFSIVVQRQLDNMAPLHNNLESMITDDFMIQLIGRESSTFPNTFAFKSGSTRVRSNVTDRYEKHVGSPSAIQYDVYHTLNLKITSDKFSP